MSGTKNPPTTDETTLDETKEKVESQVYPSESVPEEVEDLEEFVDAEIKQETLEITEEEEIFEDAPEVPDEEWRQYREELAKMLTIEDNISPDDLSTSEDYLIYLLYEALGVNESTFGFNSQVIVVYMPTDLRAIALSKLLTEAKVNCWLDTDENNALNKIVVIKRPVPNVLVFGDIALSLTKHSKETVDQFHQFFIDKYQMLVKTLSPTPTQRPINPLYSKPPTKEEHVFIQHMQKLQVLLMELLNPNSQVSEWVRRSKYAERLEILTEDMLQALKPFQGGHPPPAAVSYKAAVRNLDKNPRMMLNLMRVNPEVFKILNDNMELLYQIGKDIAKYVDNVLRQPAPVKTAAISPKKPQTEKQQPKIPPQRFKK